MDCHVSLGDVSTKILSGQRLSDAPRIADPGTRAFVVSSLESGRIRVPVARGCDPIEYKALNHVRGGSLARASAGPPDATSGSGRAPQAEVAIR